MPEKDELLEKLSFCMAQKKKKTSLIA